MSHSGRTKPVMAQDMRINHRNKDQIDDSASFDAVTVRHGIVKATLPGLKDERLWNMSTSCVV